MDKQRSTKHTHKTKDRVTRAPLKTGGELIWNLTLFLVYSWLLNYHKDMLLQGNKGEDKADDQILADVS
jgi:hypothetical protein